MLRIAAFVSPHGYGHAARCAAIIDALERRGAGCQWHVFSSVPAWLLPRARVHHEEAVDLGFVQRDALVADLDATARRLETLLPFDPRRLERLAARLHELRVDLVVCDIAPLGIAVAEVAGIPSLLVENFTWDWIYRRLGHPPLAALAEPLGEWFDRATWRIQTRPVCAPVSCDLSVDPVSRRPRDDRDGVRDTLGVDRDAILVFISMGGTPQPLPFLDRLQARDDLHFVVAGHASGSRAGNVALLPADSGFDHPSVVAASDLLVGKIGYSTLAEAWFAGVPFAAVTRRDYPEMPPLERFLEEQMPATVVAADDYADGTWVGSVDDLLAMVPVPRRSKGGAEDIARFIVERSIEVA